MVGGGGAAGRRAGEWQRKMRGVFLWVYPKYPPVLLPPPPPPPHRDFAYPAGTLPPLLVKSHGGPTSAAASGLSPLIQYWTSRGEETARGEGGAGRGGAGGLPDWVGCVMHRGYSGGSNACKLGGG